MVTNSDLDLKKFLRATQAWRSGNWKLKESRRLSRSQSRMTLETGGLTSSRCISTGIRKARKFKTLKRLHHRSGIDESLTLTKTNLDKLYGEISKTLEKISSREKYLNSQLESQLTEYR